MKDEIWEYLESKGNIQLLPVSFDAGYPFVTGLYCGILFGVELAIKRQTKAQFAWQQRFEQNGAVYILADSIEDVTEGLKSLGLEENWEGVG